MTKDQAIEHFDGRAYKLAEALGISQTTISEWKEVPPIHQLRLERITKGALRASAEAWAPARVTPKNATTF